MDRFPFPTFLMNFLGQVGLNNSSNVGNLIIKFVDPGYFTLVMGTLKFGCVSGPR